MGDVEEWWKEPVGVAENASEDARSKKNRLRLRKEVDGTEQLLWHACFEVYEDKKGDFWNYIEVLKTDLRGYQAILIFKLNSTTRKSVFI